MALNSLTRQILPSVLFSLLATDAALGAYLLHDAVSSEVLRAVPSFEACSLYLKTDGSPDDRFTVSYKPAGAAKWMPALDLVYNPKDGFFRGSVLGLKEATKYRVRVERRRAGRGVRTYQAEFTTWSSAPPVAETRDAAALSRGAVLKIRDRGAPDAWIRYTAPSETQILGTDREAAAVLLENARYVILEGLTIRGGGRYGIHVRNCRSIRIINCDIAGWGREGKQDFEHGGKYIDARGRIIDYDGAVYIDDSACVVIERCYIHAPRGRANPWRYSHPAGPEAVMVHSRGGLVLRYNDFIGSDVHRWNDVVEGQDNGSPSGGFYRDGDVYGNLFCFGNDDGIELDGGQMNIRVHHNRFEGTLCGVSTAPCLLGPSYIYRNLIVNLGDEDDRRGSVIKNNYSRSGLGRIFLFNNTACAPGAHAYSEYVEHKVKVNFLKGVMRNNLFACESLFAEGVFQWKNDFDYDLFWTGRKTYEAAAARRLHALGLESHGLFQRAEFVSVKDGDFRLHPGSPGVDAGAVVPGVAVHYRGKAPDIGAFEDDAPDPLPGRPIPVFVSKQQVTFTLAPGAPPPVRDLTVSVSGKTRFRSAFRIVKNAVFDWLVVRPDHGSVAPGAPVRLTVAVHPEKLVRSRLYRGAFLVRFPDGFSRPVMVYADNRAAPLRKFRGTGVMLYAEAERPVAPTETPFPIRSDVRAGGGQAVVFTPGPGRNRFAEYAFDLPRSGPYLLFARARLPGAKSARIRLAVAVDGGPLKRADMIVHPYWSWVMISVERGAWAPFKPIRLQKGRRRFRLYPKNEFLLDLLVLTDDPRPLFGY